LLAATAVVSVGPLVWHLKCSAVRIPRSMIDPRVVARPVPDDTSKPKKIATRLAPELSTAYRVDEV
jgi:hypothetical protein